MPFDADQFKQHFPLFSQPENSDLVYLDNAATTQRPQVVIDAMARFYLTGNANTHRASHRLARRATEMVEQTRGKAMQFLNAVSPQEIVFTRGATEALNLLAHCLTASLQPGDEIVLTTAEHHANLVPWQMAAQRHGLTLKFVPEVQGVPQWQQLSDVLSERTRVLSITAASNALGFKTDLAEVKRQLAGRDIAWVVDAAQLAAHRAIDVQAIDCDFLVCSAHKFYGPTGIGLLYGKRQTLTELPPWQGGGEMIDTVELHHSSYAQPPHRFETGTASLAAIAGLNACFDFWQSVDRSAMAHYETELVNYLHRQLAQLPGIQLLSNPPDSQCQDNVGIATFAPADNRHIDAAGLAHWLDARDIAVRAGHHCAMPLMKSRLTTGTSIRVSIAAYNTHREIDTLIEAICCCFEQLDEADSKEVNSDQTANLSLSELQQLKGWQPRYRKLMKWADVICPKPEIRIDKYRVSGCESATWINHCKKSGRHQFFIDSNARVVKGLAALLLLLVNHKTTEEIRAVNLEAVFAELGLEKHLSPSRNNGFRALVDKALQLAGVCR